MVSHSPSPASHDGLSRPDLEFERFEYLASPRVSAHSSGTETGLPKTHNTPVQTRDPHTDNKPKRPGFDWEGSWAWEVASLTLSVVGVALLIAFLVTINNTPYEDWQYTASPNTVVSIIVTVTKAALFVPVSSCLGQLKWNLFQSPAPLYHMQVIDQASRGPWGSLEVLLRGVFGSKTGILTYVGASLTILALAVDPFAQQILTFPQRTVPALNATASIQTSKHWYSGEGSDLSDVRLELPPSLLSAVIGGILQTHRPLEPRCNAGSCDFPGFSSLGICSKCEDVTAQTNQTCRKVGPAYWGDDIHPAFKEITINCTYQAPNNLSFDFESFPQFSYGLESDPYKNDHLTFRIGRWSLRARAGEPILDIQAPIVSLFEVDYTNPVFYNVSNVTAPPTKPLVNECAVYFCKREYPAITYVPGDQNSSSVHVADTQELIAQGVSDHTPGFPYYFAPPNAPPTPSEDLEYSMDFLTFTSFRPLMMSLFNSTYNIAKRNSTSDTLKLATFLRRTDISEILDSVSTSVSDTIRTNEYGTTLSGEAHRDETFIRVRWPWIILPVVVTLGSIALLLGTAIGSKQKKAMLWKCMVLPLIASHFDTTPENEIASVRRVDGMTDMSKKMRAVVVQDEGPITFKEKEN